MAARGKHTRVDHSLRPAVLRGTDRRMWWVPLASRAAASKTRMLPLLFDIVSSTLPNMIRLLRKAIMHFLLSVLGICLAIGSINAATASEETVLADVGEHQPYTPEQALTMKSSMIYLLISSTSPAW
jgi:hypothetical protein